MMVMVMEIEISMEKRAVSPHILEISTKKRVAKPHLMKVMAVMMAMAMAMAMAAPAKEPQSVDVKSFWRIGWAVGLSEGTCKFVQPFI